MSLQDKASIVLPKGFAGKAGTLECWNPNTDSLVGLSVVRATTATRVNESGLIESVAANVPRRDFTNGGCGDLLVEPQRTNNVPYSENLDPATTSWYVDVGTFVFTANTDIAPDGNNTADTLSDNDASRSTQWTYNSPVFSGEVNRASFYIKKDSDTSRFPEFAIDLNGAGNNHFIYCQVNTQTGEMNVRTSAGTVSNTIKSFNDEYWHLTLTVLDLNNGNTTATLVIRPSATTTFGTFEVSATGSIVCWGVMHEGGTYSSSYIPTSGSAVTRNADVISGTGLAALLGQSGGVYIECKPYDFTVSQSISLGKNTTGFVDRVLLRTTQAGNRASVFISKDSTTYVSLDTPVSSLNSGDYNKYALRYALNNFAIYLNGINRGSDNSLPIFDSGDLTTLRFASSNNTEHFYGRIRELVIFNEAPDNTQLAAITTP